MKIQKQAVIKFVDDYLGTTHIVVDRSRKEILITNELQVSVNEHFYEVYSY